jgi:hypothetical protein
MRLFWVGVTVGRVFTLFWHIVKPASPFAPIASLPALSRASRSVTSDASTLRALIVAVDRRYRIGHHAT